MVFGRMVEKSICHATVPGLEFQFEPLTPVPANTELGRQQMVAQVTGPVSLMCETWAESLAPGCSLRPVLALVNIRG